MAQNNKKFDDVFDFNGRKNKIAADLEPINAALERNTEEIQKWQNITGYDDLKAEKIKKLEVVRSSIAIMVNRGNNSTQAATRAQNINQNDKQKLLKLYEYSGETNVESFMDKISNNHEALLKDPIAIQLLNDNQNSNETKSLICAALLDKY